jgi:hypothetical protein
VRFRLSLTSKPVDIATLVAVVPALADKWRAVAFADGAAVVNGSPTDRLTVVNGVHPLPGAQYRVRVSGPEQTWLADVIRDAPDALQFRLTEREHEQTIEVTVCRPSAPDELDVTATIEGQGGWWTPGRLSFALSADLAALESPHPSQPQVRAEMSHPRLRAHLTLALDASQRDDWTVTLDGAMRGRGLARPIVAAASPVLQVLLRRYAKRWANDFAARVDEFNRTLAAHFGSPASPDKIAEAVLRDFLATVATPSVP